MPRPVFLLPLLGAAILQAQSAPILARVNGVPVTSGAAGSSSGK
jgi:hypothetical protein